MSQEGGIPLRSQSGDGTAADKRLFPQRAQARSAPFNAAESPSWGVADSPLYTQATAANLQAVPCISRLPATLPVTEPRIAQALESATWQVLDATPRFQEVAGGP